MSQLPAFNQQHCGLPFVPQIVWGVLQDCRVPPAPLPINDCPAVAISPPGVLGPPGLNGVSISGPQGPQGPQGLGIAGPQGPIGPQGARGATGASGGGGGGGGGSCSPLVMPQGLVQFLNDLGVPDPTLGSGYVTYQVVQGPQCVNTVNTTVYLPGQGVMLGKTQVAVNQGASGLVNIYGGNQPCGSETPTGHSQTAYSRFADIPVNTWVLIAKIGTCWEIIAAACPTS